MRSRAHFRGHPIHPMLIPFPIAFLLGALAADLVAIALGREELHVTAWYLLIAGVVMGLVAAVPGLVDYFGTVPPRSSARKRATRHMLLNVAALALFGLAWFLRGDSGVAPEPVLIGIELSGALLLTIGGWMGGTLAYRNQIGVDHRYARAGKWKEERVGPAEGGRIAVGTADELEPDQMKLLHLDGRRIVLARTEADFVAFDDRCPHRGGSLAGGTMACGTVTCPWHGSQFDVRSGAVGAGPAETSVRTHRVEREGDRLYLRLLDD